MAGQMRHPCLGYPLSHLLLARSVFFSCSTRLLRKSTSVRSNHPHIYEWLVISSGIFEANKIVRNWKYNIIPSFSDSALMRLNFNRKLSSFWIGNKNSDSQTAIERSGMDTSPTRIFCAVASPPLITLLVSSWEPFMMRACEVRWVRKRMSHTNTTFLYYNYH